MPLSEVASAKPRKRTANVQHVTTMTQRKARRCNDENKALPKPRNRRVLSKCTWMFYNEPDLSNFGPQLIVTEPNGSNHYLVDPETFAFNLRKRSNDFREETDILVDAEFFGTPNIDGQIYDAEDDLDDSDGTQVHVGTCTAQAPVPASTKLRTRLRGGIMQRWRKRISGNTLLLHHTREPCSALFTPRAFGRKGRTNSFDFSDSRSVDYRCNETGEVLTLLKLCGELGI